MAIPSPTSGPRLPPTGRTKRGRLIKANPFLEHFTVADLKVWADRKMRGSNVRLTEVLATDAKP
jgi:hypothetical protein